MVAYELALPEAAKIHPVFHVSLLKLYTGDHSSSRFPSSLLFNNWEPQILPAQLLQFRQLKRNSEWVPQVLFRWTHLSADDDSWEDLAEL